MIALYKNYFWKKGVPCGMEKSSDDKGILYRIVADPYRKWITLEEYDGKNFSRIIYDSHFLDFRKLSPKEQIAWRRVEERVGQAWIYNEDDRLILEEHYEFQKDLLRSVKIYSPYKHLICKYEMPSGPEGEIILKDSHDHVVMKRNLEGIEFWDMTPS